MRRAPIVLSATALGLAATLSFNTHHHAPAAATAAAVSSTAASGSSASPSSSAKTVTSDAIGTQYGNVQLKVTVSGGRITGVTALHLPSNDPRSQEIGAYAEPRLRQSALSKQDGTVDAVSGATYTSAGYQQALQSALDTAGFRAASATAGSSAT